MPTATVWLRRMPELRDRDLSSDPVPEAAHRLGAAEKESAALSCPKYEKKETGLVLRSVSVC